MAIKTTTGSSVFAGAINGIKSSFYLLGNGKGVTMDNILNPSEEKRMYSYMNYNFSSYLAANFANLDKNGDGTITESEVDAYTSKLSTNGLTYNELVQLCAQGGGTNSLLETVLNNFSEIDQNGDGRITNAEITAYNIEQQKDEIEEKYPQHDMSSMSIFYDTSAHSSQDSSKTKKS